MDFAFLDLNNTRTLLGVGIGVAVLLWLAKKWLLGPKQSRPQGRPRTLDAVDTVTGWMPEATRVLAPRHLRALAILERALPDRTVLAQVPLSHFLKVPTRHSYAEWMRRVGHITIDLMICDSASNVLAVVEVRQADRVETERARKRHLRLERVLRAAGIPLHVWNESMMPDLSTVRRTFAPASVDTATDQGPDTSPLGLPAADRKDPPRSSWFDDLHATQPTRLDSVEVIHGGAVPTGMTAPRFRDASAPER
jgi:hypothetical protein